MKEYSCGAVIFRRNASVLEFLVVQQTYGKHRFFPKGHREIGETEEETARREILEEVGLSVQMIPGFTYTFRYIIHNPQSIQKTVTFFLSEVNMSDTILLSTEISQARRLPYDQALACLTYATAQQLLSAAYHFILTM